MSTSIFAPHEPIANYEHAKLYEQFTLLTQTIKGEFHPLALTLGKQTQELIGNLRWKNFKGSILLQRSWVVLVVTRLLLPKGLNGQIRFSNVYGETSGIPMIGAARLESNWTLPILIRLLPPDAYWQLALAKEPFTLLVDNDQVSLNTYRFYNSDFYLATLDYLTSLAERCLASPGNALDAISTNRLIVLPWSVDDTRGPN